MSPLRPHTAIALLASAAFVLILAGPASAVTPDGNAVLTVTNDNPAREDFTATIAGECPAGTTQALVDWDWTDGSGAHTLQSPFVVDPLMGTFSDSYYFSNFVSRGQLVTFSLSCLDAADGVLASASQPYTQPDFGQTLSVPGTVAINAGIIATLNCPSAGVNQLVVTQYRGATELTPTQWILYTGPGTYNLGTPAEAGVAAGDTISVYVNCVVSGEGNLYVSQRNTNYSAVAAAVAVTPPASNGTGGGSLADTGSQIEWQSIGAGYMAILGVSMILLARSRRRSV